MHTKLQLHASSRAAKLASIEGYRRERTRLELDPEWRHDSLPKQPPTIPVQPRRLPPRCYPRAAHLRTCRTRGLRGVWSMGAHHMQPVRVQKVGSPESPISTAPKSRCPLGIYLIHIPPYCPSNGLPQYIHYLRGSRAKTPPDCNVRMCSLSCPPRGSHNTPPTTPPLPSASTAALSRVTPSPPSYSLSFSNDSSASSVSVAGSTAPAPPPLTRTPQNPRRPTLAKASPTTSASQRAHPPTSPSTSQSFLSSAPAHV
jgi:hypothetical protein